MGEPRPTLSVTRRAGLGLLLAAAFGCTNDGSRRDDPLLSSGPRPGNQPLAVATANPTGPGALPPPAYQPRPPVTPAMPTSNAALAAGGFQALPGSSDLRIGSGPPSSQPFTDPRAPTPVPAPGVAMPGAPVPVPPPGTAPAPVIPVSAPRSVGGLDQALAAAAARNPLYHKLQYNAQERVYTFVISVPDRLNTSLQRTVEATAASPAEAIARALEQLGTGP